MDNYRDYSNREIKILEYLNTQRQFTKSPELILFLNSMGLININLSFSLLLDKDYMLAWAFRFYEQQH